MEGQLEKIMESAINDWENCDMFSAAKLNDYIERYEDLFITLGFFQKGLRIRPVPSSMLITSYHHTLDGMKGILSLNVAILRRKIEK